MRVPPLVAALSAAGFAADETSCPFDLEVVLRELRGNAHMVAIQLGGVRVEIFAPWHPFHQRVVQRSPERDLGSRKIRIHPPEDLIVFKKIFDRPKDLQDIRAVLLANRGLLDLDQIRREAARLLTDASMDELEQLLVQHG